MKIINGKKASIVEREKIDLANALSAREKEYQMRIVY